MNRIKRVAWVGLFLSVVMTGCQTSHQEPFLAAPAGLQPEPVVIWTRPAEMAMEMTAETVGLASQFKIFGITVSGDRPLFSGQSFFMTQAPGVRSLSGLERIAALRAMRGANADGIYVIESEIVRRNYLLWSYNDVSVKGFGLNVTYVGPVSEARADADRIARYRR